MTKLTQKLLQLDSQTYEALKMSNQLAQEMMQKADAHAQKMLDEAKERFEKQKEKDLRTLSKKIEKETLLQADMLEKKMQDFDENFAIGQLVSHLIVVAEEKVCL